MAFIRRNFSGVIVLLVGADIDGSDLTDTPELVDGLPPLVRGRKAWRSELSSGMGIVGVRKALSPGSSLITEEESSCVLVLLAPLKDNLRLEGMDATGRTEPEPPCLPAASIDGRGPSFTLGLL
jgi:hypothetical protein